MTTTTPPTHPEPAAPEPAAAHERPRAATGHRRHPAGRSSAAPLRPSDLPREYRIAHVFRTLGGGLVAEYDPA